MRPWGGPAGFSALYVQSIDAFFAAEGAYRHGDYQTASDILAAFWAAHPPGTAEWLRELTDEEKLIDGKGLNFGRPVCYYALRMLTECAKWRLHARHGRAARQPVRLTVVLVGQSHGLEPTSLAEVGKSGQPAHHELDPSLASSASSDEVLDQSLYLFTEYVGGDDRWAPAGRATRPARLPALDVPVSTRLASANPPIDVTLRYAAPPKELLRQIVPASVTPGPNPTKTLRWRNVAGRSWPLTPDLDHGVLETGAANPYVDDQLGHVFRIVLRRDADGNALPAVAGFMFNGDFYRRTDPDAPH